MEITFKTYQPPVPTERSRLKILVVDDNHHSLVKTSEILKEIEASILVAASGKEALDWFHSSTPLNLVLLDLYMPDMSGFKVFEEIKKTEWYSRHRVPVIAVSSNMLAEPKQKFLQSSGFSDYITKPLQRDKLVTMVRHHARANHIDPTAGWY